MTNNLTETLELIKEAEEDIKSLSPMSFSNSAGWRVNRTALQHIVVARKKLANYIREEKEAEK